MANHPWILGEVSKDTFSGQFLEWKEESELNRKKETETLLTPDEVASKYRISKVTLWRWAKDGLLKPVKMGRKSFYRQSDIERVFDLNK